MISPAFSLRAVLCAVAPMVLWSAVSYAQPADGSAAKERARVAAEWCKANPEKCREAQEKMKARQELCKADPEKCRAETRARADERFKGADANKDGKLTREEAQKSMPVVARHFDEVDANKDGFVTREELDAAQKARAAQRQEKAAPKP